MTVPSDTPCCSVRSLDRVVLVDIARLIRGEDIDRISDAVETALASGPVEIVVRVQAGVAFPTHSARGQFGDFLRKQRGRVRAIHVALEGHGFWAATMTALVANVSRAVPFGPPMHVYSCVDEASAGVAEGPEIALATSGIIDRAAIARAFQRAG